MPSVDNTKQQHTARKTKVVGIRIPVTELSDLRKLASQDERNLSSFLLRCIRRGAALTGARVPPPPAPVDTAIKSA